MKKAKTLKIISYVLMPMGIVLFVTTLAWISENLSFNEHGWMPFAGIGITLVGLLLSAIGFHIDEKLEQEEKRIEEEFRSTLPLKNKMFSMYKNKYKC